MKSDKKLKEVDGGDYLYELSEAIEDTRHRRNLHGPFKTAEEAVASMLEE